MKYKKGQKLELLMDDKRFDFETGDIVTVLDVTIDPFLDIITYEVKNNLGSIGYIMEEHLKEIDESKEELPDIPEEITYEYCKCWSPELVDSIAYGKAFKYCRACKKEKK